MGLKHFLALLPLVVPIAQAQIDNVSGNVATTTTSVTTNDAPNLFDDTTTDATATNEPETVSAPIYTPEECNNWIGTMKNSDVDSSNGLSSTEYFGFLTGIEEPPYIAEYFEEYSSFDVLPWVFRVVHKSLACHCQKLGMGEECCEGDNAEVLLLGLEEAATPSTDAEEEYKDLFCQQIAYVLTKSIQSPAPTDAPSLSPTKSPTAGPTQSPSSSPTPSPVAAASDPPSVSLGPTVGPSISLGPTIGEQAAAVGSLGAEGGSEEVKDDGGLGTGAIIGILLALLAAVFAIIALVVYRREQDRSKVTEVEAPEADLEAPPPVMEEKVPEPEPEPEPEPAAEPEQAPEPDEDDESSAPSVWSESSEDDDTMGEMQDDNDIGESRASTGSALAAMGAASTVAANLMSTSPTPSPKGADAESAVPGEIDTAV